MSQVDVLRDALSQLADTLVGSGEQRINVDLDGAPVELTMTQCPTHLEISVERDSILRSWSAPVEALPDVAKDIYQDFPRPMAAGTRHAR